MKVHFNQHGWIFLNLNLHQILTHIMNVFSSLLHFMEFLMRVCHLQLKKIKMIFVQDLLSKRPVGLTKMLMEYTLLLIYHAMFLSALKC